MKRTIQVTLDADTAAFLEFSRAESGLDDTSLFINTLLRHERFRQGFSAHGSLEHDEPGAYPLSRKYAERYGEVPNPRMF